VWTRAVAAVNEDVLFAHPEDIVRGLFHYIGEKKV